MLAASGAVFRASRSRCTSVREPDDKLVVLAAEGQPTYFRGRVRVPVDADADFLGVRLFRNTSVAISKLDSAAQQLGLVPMVISELAKAQGLRLYQARPGQGATAVGGSRIWTSSSTRARP